MANQGQGVLSTKVTKITRRTTIHGAAPRRQGNGVSPRIDTEKPRRGLFMGRRPAGTTAQASHHKDHKEHRERRFHGSPPPGRTRATARDFTTKHTKSGDPGCHPTPPRQDTAAVHEGHEDHTKSSGSGAPPGQLDGVSPRTDTEEPRRHLPRGRPAPPRQGTASHHYEEYTLAEFAGN